MGNKIDELDGDVRQVWNSTNSEFTNEERAAFPLDRDMMALIFHKLSLTDLLSASQTCRNWRYVAEDKSQLRPWTYDDNILDLVGLKASITPMKAKTPKPKLWVNPTESSPLSLFKTPRSLISLGYPVNKSTPITARRGGNLIDTISSDSPDAAHASTSSRITAFDYQEQQRQEQRSGSGSPRTPSPIQSNVESSRLFSDTVRSHVKAGRFLGDVDIRSSRLSDYIVQLILKACPNLHTLRLQHICRSRIVPGDGPDFHEFNSNNGNLTIDRCGCEKFTDNAFRRVAEHCPGIGSLTLVLQHIAYKKVLRKMLADIGALPNLHTLSVELRMPSSKLSIKSEYHWQENARCTDKEVYALINAGPPPLQALALNRCDLSELCVATLAAACPELEAIDLHSQDELHFGDPGMFPAVGVQLKALQNLTAGALGTFTRLDDCHFESWCLPALTRLRLETRQPLSVDHLQYLRAACPNLESLHLIWETPKGFRETQIYPFTDASILEYKQATSPE